MVCTMVLCFCTAAVVLAGASYPAHRPSLKLEVPIGTKYLARSRFQLLAFDGGWDTELQLFLLAFCVCRANKHFTSLFHFLYWTYTFNAVSQATGHDAPTTTPTPTSTTKCQRQNWCDAGIFADGWMNDSPYPNSGVESFDATGWSDTYLRKWQWQ